MFITNNHALLHLWWKEILVKFQEVFKYYVHDCLNKILLLFVFLLTAPIVKNSHILFGIYFMFLKKHPGWNLEVFHASFYSCWKEILVKSQKVFKYYVHDCTLLCTHSWLRNTSRSREWLGTLCYSFRLPRARWIPNITWMSQDHIKDLWLMSLGHQYFIKRSIRANYFNHFFVLDILHTWYSSEKCLC